MRFPSILLSLFLLFALFGCISETDVSTNSKDSLQSISPFDFNDDGINEVSLMNFAPVKLKNGMTVSRQVIAKANVDYKLSSFNDITDANQLMISSHLNDFLGVSDAFVGKCSNNIGLQVDCLEGDQCARLCAGMSADCAKVVKIYNSELGISLLDFVKQRRNVEGTLSSLMDSAKKLPGSNPEKRIAFVNDLSSLVNYYSDLLANPVFVYQNLKLCDTNGLDATSLDMILSILGNVDRSVSYYDYRVMINTETTNSGLSFVDVSMTDIIPNGAEDVYSPQPSTINKQVVWESVKISSDKPKHIFIYAFSSTLSPEEMQNNFQSPNVVAKEFSFGFLNPVFGIYGFFYGITNNYHLSLGFAFAFAVIIILLLYLLLRIIISVARAYLAKEPVQYGFKRVVSRTGITWRSDIVVGVVCLIIAFVTSFMFAKSVNSQLDIYQSIDLWVKSDIWSFVSVVAFFLGGVFVYLAAENKVKVHFLEQFYGKEISGATELFSTRVSRLKDKLNELKSLIDSLSKEDGFDVGREYDVLASISLSKINEASKNPTSDYKRAVESDLARVEDAVEALIERKKTADENWPKWSEDMKKIVQDNGEIYLSSLSFIPSSLRSWALTRFIKENKSLGLSLENEAVKKKTINMADVADDFVRKDLFKAVVLTKNGKVISSKVKDGSDTVVSMLSLKMFGYLSGLLKTLRFSSYNSVASVGNRLVMVAMKQDEYESMVIVEKAKFKDSIAKWRETVGRLS
ncbi:MAG: hypothetical protein ABII22_03355 [Candidatus Micrarchaeota archaeon]